MKNVVIKIISNEAPCPYKLAPTNWEDPAKTIADRPCPPKTPSFISSAKAPKTTPNGAVPSNKGNISTIPFFIVLGEIFSE
jgi:hypothetical protein